MAGQQPTQPLPSWLSFSSFTTVDASGAPTTEATIVTLPLTYFGPSIPLGTNGVWVFGGSTSPPPSTSTSPTTTSLISSTSSTPTPTPTSSSITQSNTSVESSTTAATTTSESSATATNTSTGSVISSSSSTTSPSTSSSPSSSLSSSSSTTNALSTTSSSSSSNTAGSSTPSGTSTSSQGTPTSPTSHLKSLHTGAIVGIVVGSVVALLLLLLLFFCCWRHRRRLRMLRRRSGWSGFDEVPAAELAGATAPGMGEHERDTLMVSEGDEAGPSTGPAVAFSSEPAPVPEGPRHITEHQFDDPRPSSDHGGVEGVGIALAGPDGDEETSSRSSTLSALIRQERARSTNPQELARSLFWSPSQPSVTRAPLRQSELLRLPDTHDELGLPRDGPSPSLIALSPPPRRSSSQNSPTNNSPLQPPRTLNPDMIPTASSRASGSRSRHSATPSMAYPDSPISETDEGAAFLTARRVRVEQPSAWFMQSLNRLSNRLSWFNRTSEAERSPPASRPASRPTSAAFGRLTDDEIAAGRAMMQVSRDQLLLTRPVSGVSAASSRGTVYHDAPSRPGSVSEPPLSARTFGRPPSEYNVPTSDVLDMPAPPPASTLSSTRSSRNPIFPPGLSSIPNPAVFQSTSSTSAEGSQSVPRSPIVSMASDGLEDEPPRAGEQWTHLQGSTRGGGLHPGGSSSRLDLGHGVVVHPRGGTLSEQASLHSMRSHLGLRSPGSMTSGSRPQSHQNGSGSSRSGASLAHSGSISSDGRRKVRARTSHGELGHASLSAMSVGRRHGSPSPLRASASGNVKQPSSRTVTSLSSDGTGTGTGTSTTTTVHDSVTGATMYFPTRVWAREQGAHRWPSDAWTEMDNGLGARWFGPPETLLVYRAETGDPGFM